MEMNATYLSYASWAFFSALQRSTFTPLHNHVHWTETPTSHLYAADLPGLRKEEIRVEVEDSKYMVIRTELCSTGTGTEEEEAERVRQRSFNRKFRLPVRVDVEGITARYEDGVLTVTVPRLLRRAQINSSGLDEALKSVARAA